MFKSLSSWAIAHKILAAAIAGVFVVALGGIVFAASRDPELSTVKVARGTVSESVSVSGKVVAAKDLSLAFETSGKVREVRVKVGDKVLPGAVLVVLDQSSLLAERARMEANLQAEEARLDELKRGSRPEEVRIKETALRQAEQNLSAQYFKVPETVGIAWNDADDGVRQEMDPLFINDERPDPKLSFETSDFAAKGDAEALRVVASTELSLWRTESDALYVGNSTTANLEKALTESKRRLLILNNLVNRTADALRAEQRTPEATLADYKDDVSAARAKVTRALSSITSLTAAINADKLAVERAKNDLKLLEAGTVPEVLKAQEARVAQARASVLDVDARLSKAVLRAPISGVVTLIEAKTGEIVAPNITAVGMISDADFEIEANVPEVEVGKVEAGDKAQITLDAFLGEVLEGMVTYIDPAETLVDGVVNFKAKISINAKDPRIKSGMTANLTMITQAKEGVLYLPLSAVGSDGSSTFIDLVRGKELERQVVTVGLRGDGTIEITGGIEEGTEVLRTAGK